MSNLPHLMSMAWQHCQLKSHLPHMWIVARNKLHSLLRLCDFRFRELPFPRFTWIGPHKFHICVFTSIPPFPRSNVGKMANYTAVVLDKAADASLLLRAAINDDNPTHYD